MSAEVVSIRIFNKLTDAEPEAARMRSNGFDVSPILEATRSVKLSDCTVEPPKNESINAPAWVVIGTR